MRYSWSTATLQQLYHLAYEEDCPQHLKHQAVEEINRRKRRKMKHTRTNFKEVKHY